MYKYDIPFPKEGQLTLRYGGIPINVSKKKSYLVEKMKAHRDSMVETGNTAQSLKYEIVNCEGQVIHSYIFKKDEAGNAKNPYRKQADKKEFFVRKNGFKLIANSNGKILTDEKLLKHLYDFRFIKRFPVIITNTALVSMATYKPENKEQFIGLKGIGLKVYEKCGEEFLDEIKGYLNMDK